MHTPWKKSRTFGDIYGGRTSRKIPDRIFRRAHSIDPPAPDDETPIFIVDNPSREFYFPLKPDEVRQELSHLPKQDWVAITHIWHRRFKKTEYEAGELPLAEFICGSGVRLVVLYPWPKSLSMPLGKAKPSKRLVRYYSKYDAEIEQKEAGWYLQWSESAIKNFCVEQLLYHEIGHHVDRYNHRWSQANQKPTEEFANQYAFERTSKRSIFYSADT